jgi:hypothetical protein
MPERKIIINTLVRDQLISPEDQRRLENYEQNKLFSLFWEIKTVLYLGILLFSAGAGMLIYLNIDTIGHLTIIALLGIACFACFYYVFKKSEPFSFNKISSTNPWNDYVLLLGCLLFLSLETYSQIQYNLFGTQYGTATILPTLLFFLLAYRFDHKGVLSMAITGLAGWAGIAVTPMEVIDGLDNFSDHTYIWTALGLACFLITLVFVLQKINLKTHFTFTYLNFAIHILFIATLAGLFAELSHLLFIPLLLAIGVYYYFQAQKLASYYFLLFILLYLYIGITYILFYYLLKTDRYWDIIYVGFFYFIGSCALAVFLIKNHKSLLKI